MSRPRTPASSRVQTTNGHRSDTPSLSFSLHVMVSSFPSPLLSLAADAIQDMDGADAVTGLWTSAPLPLSILSFLTFLPVFTKCKESIQDGPRLENISWRLWHRHLSANSRSKHPLLTIPPHSPHLISAPCPLTPTSELGVEHSGTFYSPFPLCFRLFLTLPTFHISPRVLPRIPRALQWPPSKRLYKMSLFPHHPSPCHFRSKTDPSHRQDHLRYDPSQARPRASQVPTATRPPQTRSHHRRRGSWCDGRHTGSERAPSSPFHSTPPRRSLPTRRGRQPDSSPHPSRHTGAIRSPYTSPNNRSTSRAALSAIRGWDPA